MPGHTICAASDILETLLSFSGGMSRRIERKEIVTRYAVVAETFRARHRVQTNALHRPSRVRIVDLDSLQDRLCVGRPAETILITGNVGHPLAFADACVRGGIPLAIVFHTMEERFQSRLRTSGAELICVRDARSTTDLFRRMDESRKSGRYLSLVVDAPSAARTTVNFLGYRAPISRLTEAYARRTGSAVYALVSSVVSAQELSFKFRTVKDQSVEGMIELVEHLILEQPEQYRWTSSAVFFADDAARAASISFLLPALTFRHWGQTLDRDVGVAPL